jgi:hypothetical protein
MTDLAALVGPLWPYLLIIIVGFMPSEIWRVLGVLLSHGLDERSEILVWIRAVAATLLAGVVAKLLLTPSGALAVVPLFGRVGSLLIGVAGYFVVRRSVIAGIILAEVTLIAITWLVDR